jgi:hypothetical protein
VTTGGFRLIFVEFPLHLPIRRLTVSPSARTPHNVPAWFSRTRPITTVECAAPTLFTTMSATDYCPDLLADVPQLKNELLEIRHGKISLHHAEAGYRYPTIRLPQHVRKACWIVDAHLPDSPRWKTSFSCRCFSLRSTSESDAFKPENASRDSKSPVFTQRRSALRPLNDHQKPFSKTAVRSSC